MITYVGGLVVCTVFGGVLGLRLCSSKCSVCDWLIDWFEMAEPPPMTPTRASCVSRSLLN